MGPHGRAPYRQPNHSPGDTRRHKPEGLAATILLI